MVIAGPTQLEKFYSNEYEASARSDTATNLPFQITIHTTLNLAGV